MIFRKSKSEVQKGVKKVDSLVTGLIVWGAVASIFGLSRTKKWKKVLGTLFKTGKVWMRYGYSVFGKTLAETIDFICKKK